jgi:O-antigen ligase
MSIRLLALYLVVAGLSIYAWKDWFKSLCGLILLMAVIEHPDMPKTVLGIQGLNPWNLLFAMIFLAWAVSRRKEGLRWDMPRHISVLLLLYLGVIVVGVLRAVFDRSHIEDYPLKSLISEELVNTVKWILPGVLLYDGCRTRRRAVMALVCTLSVYLLIAVQLHRLLPIGSILQAGGDIEYTRAACIRMGYAATDLSVMLAGVSWGILATMPLIPRKKYWVVPLTAAGIVVTAQALTGGRAGYIAWGFTGLVLCLVKWRKYLVVAPVILVLLPAVFPGAAGRMLKGFGEIDAAGKRTVDDLSATSDRTFFWPYVVDKIYESPWIGYGRLAMRRIGLYATIEAERPGTGAPHPHNMYLETLLDNGVLGSIPILSFWATMLIYSVMLFRRRNRLYSAVGGLSLALVSATLCGGLAGQHIYPQEYTMGVWLSLFLMLRVYVEEEHAQTCMVNVESHWSSHVCVQQPAVA